MEQKIFGAAVTFAILEETDDPEAPNALILSYSIDVDIRDTSIRDLMLRIAQLPGVVQVCDDGGERIC